jgi:hypothetical protein
MSLLKRHHVLTVLLRKQCAASTCKTVSKQHKWVLPSGYETNISVFNCITSSKVPLILKNPNLVSWYMCGPTVYDSAHLGHAWYVPASITEEVVYKNRLLKYNTGL